MNLSFSGFDGSTTGDGNITGGEGGAVGDAQGRLPHLDLHRRSMVASVSI